EGREQAAQAERPRGPAPCLVPGEAGGGGEQQHGGTEAEQDQDDLGHGGLQDGGGDGTGGSPQYRQMGAGAHRWKTGPAPTRIPPRRDRCSSGLRGTPGERVDPKRVTWVRIPPCPSLRRREPIWSRRRTPG